MIFQAEDFTPYHEHMTELTSEDVLTGLLAHGLFSEKIPPVFSTKKFYDFYRNPKTKKDGFESKPKDYIRYENIRNINIPRPISIPHPFPYLKLCESIADNWEKLQDHFKNCTENQTHKISRIHIRKLKNKQHTFEMNYSNFNSDGTPEFDLQIKAKYIVHADISNCFPSMYSHSITWALIGKEDAKKNQTRKSEWFNRLDERVKNIKHGETNGLLIGPHTSNLISEIILVKVDQALYDKGYKFTRHVDDYKCYTESRENADSFLVDLASELKKFDLTLNHKKSKILRLPQNTDDNWVQTLRNFHFPDAELVKGKQLLRFKTLRSYVDIATNLMLEHGENSAILNYIIKTISHKYLGQKAKEHYIKRIHHLVLLYPYLAPILDKYVFQAFEVKSPDILLISRDLYSVGIKNKWYEACSYAVFFSLKYNIEISAAVLDKDAIASNDCIFMMIAYLYDKKMNKNISSYELKAKELLTDADRYWLFIYEVLPEASLANGFKYMKKNRITFVNDIFGTDASSFSSMDNDKNPMDYEASSMDNGTNSMDNSQSSMDCEPGTDAGHRENDPRQAYTRGNP